MPTALVTGHKGFIGRPLTLYLQQQGWQVVTWPGDVCDLHQLHQQVEVVFHLAAKARLNDFETQPHAAYQVNLNGILAVLNYCYKTNATLVFTSTSGVYESPKTPTALTETTPIAPSTPYALSKWLAEQLCWQQAQDLGVNCRIMRLFNVYGVGQPITFLIPYVIDSLINHKPIKLRLPQAIRDFIYLDDVITALVAAAQYQDAGYHVFNVGTGQGTEVIDLVAQVEAILGQGAVNLTLETTSTLEIPISIANIDQTSRLLGWQPYTSLDLGLRQVIASMTRV